MEEADATTHTRPMALVDGKYQAVRPIARGGMGEVLDATHRYTGRSVAVKLALPEHVSRRTVRERLLREARALGSLAHPNVVVLHDAGECAHYGAYVVIEKLEGRSLDGLLAARGTIGVEATIHLLREMASALAATHERELVHRDVKPANIFISHVRPGVERIKLLDFGLVGSLGTGGNGGLTRAGELLGTFVYMAPEQLQDASRCDGHGDLYSLGVVALECLGANVSNVGARLRLEHVASETLGRGSSAPPELVRLLDDMLAADPDSRPHDAEVVLNRLAALGTPARPPLMLGYGQRLSRPAVALANAGGGSRESVESRRKAPRAPYVTPVRLVFDGGTLDARSEDISSGGMLVISQADCSTLRGPMKLRFALPTTGRVAMVEVELRWRRQSEGRTALGLEFKTLAREAVDSVATYLQWLGA